MSLTRSNARFSSDLQLHRRLQYDDSFGVDEPLNEEGVDKKGLVARGRHLLYLGSIEDSQRKLRQISNKLVYAPQFSFLRKSSEAFDVPFPRVGTLRR